LTERNLANLVDTHQPRPLRTQMSDLLAPISKSTVRAKSRFPRPKMAGSAARDTVAADGRGRALVVDVNKRPRVTPPLQIGSTA
jgi:hypothetical protein